MLMVGPSASSKTKQERQVDHEAEKVEREREENRKKREAANKLKNQDLLWARQRKAEAEARDYARLHAQPGSHEWEEEQWEASRPEGDVSGLFLLTFFCCSTLNIRVPPRVVQFDPNEDFMVSKDCSKQDVSETHLLQAETSFLAVVSDRRGWRTTR